MVSIKKDRGLTQGTVPAPAIFILCGKDDLRPGGIAYAKKLIDAGVPVKTKEYAGAEHGLLYLCSFITIQIPDVVPASSRLASGRLWY